MYNAYNDGYLFFKNNTETVIELTGDDAVDMAFMDGLLDCYEDMITEFIPFEKRKML